MFRYVLKRLMLLLPTLWIICSLVFILSRIVPGTCLDVELERTSQSFSSGPKSIIPESQTLPPLFYFSVHSWAEPDSLYQFRPELHQTFLRNLILESGNWPAVAGFYHAFILLQTHTETLSNPAEDLLLSRIRRTFYLKTQNSVVQSIAVIKDLAQQHNAPQAYLARINLVQNKLKQIKIKPQHAWALIPAFTWHGTNNQYHSWLTTFITGDLGDSCRDQRPVNTIIAEAFFNTIFISVLSLGLIFFLALELSIWLNKTTYTKWRSPVLAILYALDSIPLFIIALTLLTLFASSAYLNLFPAYGIGANVPANVPVYLTWLYQLPFLALPVISLTIVNLPYVTGQIQQAIEQVNGRTFILTAKAKGLPEHSVLRRHVVRNALMPVITLLTGFLPALVTGAVVIEIIYAVPGMGRLLQETILARDYPVLLGIVLYLGLVKVLSHIIADILYYLADPRIRVPA